MSGFSILVHMKGGETMPNNSGTQSGNYKVPNKSQAYIPAPNAIQKDGANPTKVTGGDLRIGKGK